jgi:serine/threonine protein kinase
MFETPRRLELNYGDKVDGYTIQEVLGEGGYGIVAKVSYFTTGGPMKHAAIKFLKLYECDPFSRNEMMTRFKAEFNTGHIKSNFLSHSFNQGVYLGNPFFSMDYYQNGSLQRKIKKDISFWNENKIDKLATQILTGLHDLHSAGIIHRDLKPDNVLFDSNFDVKICDFGVSGYLNNRLTKFDKKGNPENVFGTYAYVAPEQIYRGTSYQSLGPVTDLWSFGVTMFEVISGGDLPFGNLDKNEDLSYYLDNARIGKTKELNFNFNASQNWKRKWNEIINFTLEPDYKKRVNKVLDLLKMVDYHEASDLPNFEYYEEEKVFDFNKDIIGFQVTQGEEVGRIYNLWLATAKNENATIGRLMSDSERFNNIEIKETYTRYVSRCHATVRRDFASKKWILFDGQQDGNLRCNKSNNSSWDASTNGTFINGEEVSTIGKIIQPGDIITIGDTNLKVIKKQ